MIYARPLKYVLGKIIPFGINETILPSNLATGTTDGTKFLRDDGTWSNINSYISSGNIIFVASKTDLPTAISNVITLLDNVTYYFTTIVDLLGDRIVCGQNTVMLGASSENCYLKSTGLNSSTALITSVYSLPIRNISFTHDTVFNLDGDGVTTALDWLNTSVS